MKKVLVAVILLSLIPGFSFGEDVTFKDVPEIHWARAAVYDLVKRGVTQGYPDGTFRGDKNITRYETAMFLSKLAVMLDTSSQIDVSSLKADIKALKDELDSIKKSPSPEPKGLPVTGSFKARYRVSNSVTSGTASGTAPQRGPRIDYRLKTTLSKDLGDGAGVKINLDTMDSSTVGGRNLFREMLDFEGGLNLGQGYGVSITAGPGLIIHKETGTNVIPSDDNTAYLRPNSGIKFTYDSSDFDAGAGFTATSVSTGGVTDTNDIYAYIGYTFRDTILGDIRSRYSIDRFAQDIASNHSSRESTINMYEVRMAPVPHLEIGVKYGAEGSADAPHNSYAGVSIVCDELLTPGCAAGLYYNKIGGTFLPEPAYPGLLGVNLFNKLFYQGTCDYGLEISRDISSGMTLRALSDIVTGPNGEYGEDEPASSTTYEIDLDYGVWENAVMTLGYKVFQQPAAVVNVNSNLLGVGFKYTY